MFMRRFMNDFVLVRKSTLCMAFVVAVGIVGCHYYKYHRKELMRDIDQFTDDAADVAKKSTQKAKDVVDDAKS